jgi:two-component system cell cycle response regulator
MPGRVLIIDGVASNRILMKARLAEACYDALPAADGEGAIRLACEANPDAILLDLELHDAARGTGTRDGSGLGVLRSLRSDKRLAQVPVVVLAAPTDADARIAALRAGADDVLIKPVDDHALVARLRNLLRRRGAMADLGAGEATVQALGFAEAAEGFRFAAPGDGNARPAMEPGRIALVTARYETARRLKHSLTDHATAQIDTLDRSAALSGLAQSDPGGIETGVATPDIYVLEAGPSGPGTFDGALDLLVELRSRTASRHAAYVLLRDAALSSTIDAHAFDMGVHDVIDPACDPREIALRLNAVMRRKMAADRLRASVRDGLRLAIRDDLTGLYNRRYAFHHLAGMAEAARMESSGFSVMVIDIDRFKTVNDRWGHAAGDAVLVEIARRLSQTVRMGDLLARIGGEEFLVALPEPSTTVASQVAERLRDAIQGSAIELPGGVSLTMTASIGIALCGTGHLSVPQAVPAAIDRADRAMMRAKSTGRNRVSISPGCDSDPVPDGVS